MPKLTLVVERRALQVYEIDRPVIRIGRQPELDIVIDNVAVSRLQAEIRLEGMQWCVRDLESKNGTLLNGLKLDGLVPLERGDEISFGKFSLFFGHVPTEPAPQLSASKAGSTEPGRTFVMKPEELAKLRATIVEKRRAHVDWQAGSKRGTFPLTDGPVVIGRSDRCDLQVACRGPKHHLFIRRDGRQYEVHNASWWYRMRVNGEWTSTATLRDGDEIVIGDLRLTFKDDLR